MLDTFEILVSEYKQPLTPGECEDGVRNGPGVVSFEKMSVLDN